MPADRVARIILVERPAAGLTTREMPSLGRIGCGRRTADHQDFIRLPQGAQFALGKYLASDDADDDNYEADDDEHDREYRKESNLYRDIREKVEQGES